MAPSGPRRRGSSVATPCAAARWRSLAIAGVEDPWRPRAFIRLSARRAQFGFGRTLRKAARHEGFFAKDPSSPGTHDESRSSRPVPSMCVPSPKIRSDALAFAVVLALLVSTAARTAVAQNAAPPAAPAASAPAATMPAASDPQKKQPTRFSADPVTDGALIGIGVGFAAILELIVSTGEIKPQQPGDTSALLAIDRGAATQTPSPTARTISHAGVLTTGVFAVIDIAESAASHGSPAALVDGILYAQTAALTWANTNLIKIATRRPRPSAYRERDERVAAGQDPSVTETDTALSFVSGHAAMAAALSSTATYLAFARSDSPLRGYLTLAGGVLVTSAVSWGRVRGGKHFPTDVIAGALAGVGIGVLVPHLHREDTKRPPVWVGMGPAGDAGVGLSVNGVF